MAFDITEPYGPLIESTARIAVWNVWARFGPWHERERAILGVLDGAGADIVVLVEAWETADDSQADRLGVRLGLPHRVFRGVPDESAPGDLSGIAILSRWPIGQIGEQRLGNEDGWDGGFTVFARADGPRGPLQIFGVVLGWKLGHSAQRQRQVRDLGAFVRKEAATQAPVIVAGDLNAAPDSDEVRMLTGLAAVAAPGLVFYDAWEMAGDGTPGHTWSNNNPWARPVLWPNRRNDYILSAWPRGGGAGHPVRCKLLGTSPVDGVMASDHYGLAADLRY